MAQRGFAPAGAIPGIKHVIAVASGKGGVGKSTTAVNIAVALSRMNRRVGLLDADIYGPSIPRMLGISGKPDLSPDGKMIPRKNHGVAAMSIGLLLKDADKSPVVWRGPMVISALEQMLRQVAWGEQDYLVVDMPPGTGDAHLTMTQRVPLAGAVVVSTPQDIALIDARRGIEMFQKVSVPILGLVENMSYFDCPACGHRSHVFGSDGVQRQAAELGVQLIGRVPLKLAIRERSDLGTPVASAESDDSEGQEYLSIATKIDDILGDKRSSTGPTVTIN